MSADVTYSGPGGAGPTRGVRPAVEASSELLLELAHGLRQELVRRGEFLPSSWVEEAANVVKRGRMQGWVVGPRAEDGGLAFLSPRAGRAYGHAHVTPGPDAFDRLLPLLEALRTGRSEPGARLDVGLTGLSDREEERLRTTTPPPLTTIVRHALEAPLPAPSALVPPVPLRQVPIRSVDVRSLASLDWLAFQGTPDETLVADSPAEDARVIDEILNGLLGRFLDEASTAVLTEDGGLLGFLLTAEQTPRRAIFLDLVIQPASRRRGTGLYLLRWGMRALVALGYETVRLWVTESNVPARRLYDRLGFRPVGRALIVRYPGPAAGSGEPPQPQRVR